MKIFRIDRLCRAALFSLFCWCLMPGPSSRPAVAADPTQDGARQDGAVQDRAVQSRDPLITIAAIVPKDEARKLISRYGLTRNDFRQVSSQIAMFGTTIPIRVVEHRVYAGELSTDCQIVGTSHEFEATQTAKIVKGGFLSSNDVSTNENVCVVNESAARRLFSDEDPLGRRLLINRNFFTVVGVAKTDRPTLNDNEDVVFVPFTTMRLRFGDRHVSTKSGQFKASEVELHEIRVCLFNRKEAENVTQRLKTLMKKIHSANDYRIQIQPEIEK